MSDFDSSFEAGQVAALFKPKITADPNGRGANQLLRGLSSGKAQRAISTRARLARVVGRAPEVMVKVTGRPKGKSHAAAHFDYIGRKGDVPLETRDGDILSEKDDRAALARDWGDPAYWRDSSTVAAVSMVFSMPAGTDPDKVLSAVREVARSEIAHEWDYVLALHTDTPRPHVHLTVAARGDTGRRFNPRPQTLHQYRERFAEELRARGVSAEATPRAARGIGRAGQSMSLNQMRQRYMTGTAPAPLANRKITAAAQDQHRGRAEAPEFVGRGRQQWDEARKRYLAAAQRLGESADPADRQLADQVRQFVRAGRAPTIHEQSVAAIERQSQQRELSGQRGRLPSEPVPPRPPTQRKR
ncbi:relaxase/mobilization nuclease domain-containing protein [Diaphorobacter sp. LR2014-1]|uniref:relaxase/mobilization nuclease domain-containing protein n=1 Tax=Diaphorobacter sp. LR2014-1 TaxID=1933219 RepID=UPI000CDAFEDE|nr:relaxase/mobilization nuclease domain-containing protein [Diaphorobacter sp. LR2014-1]POR06171.1 type IV secretion system protein VirD2 [Diaphorobacter sp. LR2014-1]